MLAIADSYEEPHALVGEIWLPDAPRFADYLRPFGTPTGRLPGAARDLPDGRLLKGTAVRLRL
ncbi:hypothetical protein [Dactylosporangium fulvum]|uniref:Uncharacterized protein n=1 Tax=Dactylosporangium fulvum TaxID=53359 RepID=A0ABY5VUU7_9ACTN|nr:hypothetical protein [Dactylosporangium fulvum]UWP81547.1 hypothetical protein Dfulv_41580 [Dactylosporangium fulvum]